jgi:hypothetical protein
MLIGMKGLNEQYSVKLVIGDIHDEPWVEKIIVIDGCSSDDTVHELKQFPKVQVFQHKWEKWFHAQEVVQSNILLQYIPIGEVFFILDFDEQCSPELKALLADIDENGMPGEVDCVHVSRKSYELMRFPDSPFAMPDSHGFWLISHQIGQYPDFQLRIIRRQLGMQWINSPHHSMFGLQEGLFTNKNIQADLIHYHGKEDARDREGIERQWVRHQATRTRLGLEADIFEGDVKPELAKYANPEYWEEKGL